MSDMRIYDSKLMQCFYTLDEFKRKDIFRLARELDAEDRQHRGFTFWVHEIVYDKFFGYQDTVAKRLMF